MPRVSVIMPAYNAEKTIRASIKSVTSQTFQDWELIVIDDGSRDDTIAIIEKAAAKDLRIKFFQNDKNRGVSYTRNRGVALSEGEWIAFLDSDDLWQPEKLEKQLELVRKYTHAVICYTASSFINDDDESYGYVLEAEKQVSYKMLLRKNLVSCSSVMIKASVMKKIKMPGDIMHEDYYVWLKVVREHGAAYGINEPLLIYRLGKNSKSSGRIRSAKMLFNTYRAVGYSFVVACALLLRYTLYSVNKRKKIYSSAK